MTCSIIKAACVFIILSDCQRTIYIEVLWYRGSYMAMNFDRNNTWTYVTIEPEILPVITLLPHHFEIRLLDYIAIQPYIIASVHCSIINLTKMTLQNMVESIRSYLNNTYIGTCLAVVECRYLSNIYGFIFNFKLWHLFLWLIGMRQHLLLQIQWPMLCTKTSEKIQMMKEIKVRITAYLYI